MSAYFSEAKSAFLLDEIGRLREEISFLEAQLVAMEEGEVDAQHPRYQRYSSEKRMLMENLCSLRLSILPAAPQAAMVASTSPMLLPLHSPRPSQALPSGSAFVAPTLYTSVVESGKRKRPLETSDANRVTTSACSYNPAADFPTLPSGNSDGVPEDGEVPDLANAYSTDMLSSNLSAPQSGSIYTANGTTVSSLAPAATFVSAQTTSMPLDELDSTNKKRKLPDVNLEQYTLRKNEVGSIMRNFTDKRVVLVDSDGNDVNINAYQTFKARVKQGEDISKLLRGSLEKYVTSVDKRKGEVVEKQIFVPEYRFI